jgi:hypothetical protein
MRVEFAFLAKAVDLGPHGTFSVQEGGLETMEAEKVPGAVSSLTAISQIAADKEEDLGEHRLCIQVFSPQGNKINAFPEITFQLGQSIQGPSSMEKFLCVTPMQGMPLPAQGVYEIRFSVDDQVLKSIPLLVRTPELDELALQQEIAKHILPLAQLDELAEKNPPPQSWYEEEELPF